MKNSDYKIPPFSLVYNMYISGLYGASYFVFIAKNEIYCLRVYVYIICNLTMQISVIEAQLRLGSIQGSLSHLITSTVTWVISS
jgi:hypothetical protein